MYAINATQRVQIHNAHCSDEIHSPLQRADPKSIQCTYSNCVAEACSCRTTWYTGSKVLRCQALSKLPRGVPEIRALLARENNVTELTSDDLPDSLLVNFRFILITDTTTLSSPNLNEEIAQIFQMFSVFRAFFHFPFFSFF